MGQSVSIAIAGAVFVGLGGATAGNMIVTHINPTQLSTYQQIFDRAFHATFLVCAFIAAIGIFASLMREKAGLRDKTWQSWRGEPIPPPCKILRITLSDKCCEPLYPFFKLCWCECAEGEPYKVLT